MGQDEHEMLVEYSEMTAFNFDSKEFREVAKDVRECKSTLAELSWNIKNFLNKFKSAKAY